MKFQPSAYASLGPTTERLALSALAVTFKCGYLMYILQYNALSFCSSSKDLHMYSVSKLSLAICLHVLVLSGDLLGWPVLFCGAIIYYTTKKQHKDESSPVVPLNRDCRI